MEVTRRVHKKRNKGKGNKDDGRNSNASLKQSESISVFVLLSLGSLNSEERESCVELVCVCVSIQRYFVCVSGLLRERALADVCILAGWTVFAFESTSMRACTKGDASLCTHTWWHSSITLLFDQRQQCEKYSASSEGLSALLLKVPLLLKKEMI